MYQWARTNSARLRSHGSLDNFTSPLPIPRSLGVIDIQTVCSLDIAVTN